MLYGQTSEVYSYISNYVVNTGTGEKKQWHTTLHYYCRFNSDKSICYETNDKGTLKSEIHPGDETIAMREGCHGYYQPRGCYEYHYLRTENGVRIYEEHCHYYNCSRLETDSRGFFTGQRTFSEPKEYKTYIYFSSDFSKMNRPRADNEVFTYDRIFPDKIGSPTQIW